MQSSNLRSPYISQPAHSHIALRRDLNVLNKLGSFRLVNQPTLEN